MVSIKQPCVAYFCMEFGLHESFPIYSGGLGILAGDIMKAACDQERALVGVGILWDEGYTIQKIDENGQPYDQFVKTTREYLKRLEPTVNVTLRGKSVELRAWEVNHFGSNPLILLEPVSEDDLELTARLYNGDRLAQELILGVGGVRMLRALDMDVRLYHFNEGHALFAGFELLREEMVKGVSFSDARAIVKDRVVFTTHTPVVAGNETHSIEDMLDAGADLDGTFDAEKLEQLGENPFQMTVAALRLSRAANAVAKLHGKTAAKMWDWVQGIKPIIPITNGVHMRSWQDERLAEAAKPSMSDESLWGVHQQLKDELLHEIERTTGSKMSGDTLLIGFARRAATYKRATLVLRDLEWLQPLLEAGKVQFVFSGKAHPADQGGKALVAQIVEMTKRFPNQIAFLENYNMRLGRLLTRGCDVWLNNPLRPMEASGTSGMKAAANGCLNVSILDGWWDEGCKHGVNGWQFGDAYEGEGADEHDLHALKSILSNEVLPTYYDDRRRWVAMMRSSVETAVSEFSAAVMLNRYYESLYP